MGNRVKGLTIAILLSFLGLDLFIEEIPETTAGILKNFRYILNAHLSDVAIAKIPARPIRRTDTSLENDSELVVIVYKDKHLSVIEREVADSYLDTSSQGIIARKNTLLKSSDEAVHFVLGPKLANSKMIRNILDGNKPTDVTISTAGCYYRNVYANVIGVSFLLTFITYVLVTLYYERSKQIIYDEKADSPSRLPVLVTKK